MVSVLPVSAAPSRNDANEFPPPLASVVAPGTAVSRKLKPARPPISCCPNPLACCRSKVKPDLIVCEPLLTVRSSLIENRGCSVPLYDDPPHVANSEKETMPKFWLQSTAFGMQMPRSRQP